MGERAGTGPRQLAVGSVTSDPASGWFDLRRGVPGLGPHDEKARDYVARADEIRLEYIRSLFAAHGFQGLDAENRARLYLYYEMGEPAVFAEQSAETEDALIRRRIDLLTRRDDT